MREIKFFKKPIFWLGLVVILSWAAVFSLPDNRLHLVFCDVGQGDAILISYKSTQVLVDGGPDSKVIRCLASNMPFWDRTLEMIILTHPQADHFTGLIDVIKRYNISQFVINSVVSDSAGFWEFHQAVLTERTPVYSPKARDRLKIGPMEFLILWPEQKLGDPLVWQKEGLTDKEKILGVASIAGEINKTSIVLKLSFDNFDALLTGDIGFDIEKQLELAPVEVLKVAHHGSKYSTSQEFLKQVKPALAVISVGKNRFGHPTKEVIEELRDLDIKILRTDEEGEIEIVSDGKNWYTKKL